MRRIIIVIVIAAVVIGGIFVVSQQNAAANKPPAQRLELRKATIGTGDVTVTVNATGGAIANQQSDINFKTTGTIKEVLVQEGQRVKTGDVLATLDNTSQTLALAQADSALQTARLSLTQLLDPPDARDVTVAEANVKAAQGAYNSVSANVSRPQTITTAQLNYQKALQALDDAQYLRAGAGGIYATTDPNYQLSVAKVGQASFAAQQAKIQLDQATRGAGGSQLPVAGARIALAQAQLAQVKSAPAQVQIDRAQALVDQAQLARDQAQHQLDKTQLKAPYAGEVSLINIHPGELTPGATAAISMTDDSAFFIDVKVDEVDIQSIQPGQKVTFTLDALSGETATGTVKRIALTANLEATVTFTVRVELDSTDLPLKAGMTANATFTAHQAHDVMRVPNTFVRVDRVANQSFVTVVNADGTLSEVQIQVGLRSDDYSEVISGLNEGDVVAVSADGSPLPVTR